jgi:hypothetical protein
VPATSSIFFTLRRVATIRARLRARLCQHATVDHQHCGQGRTKD